ncbi:MAG: uroporphyrinogen-III synthase [Minwuia sp.]|nr:uroporphyrinogen-III synthase [Minwuia sp.]
MRVLVTRPEADAAETETLLRAMGHEVLIDPVLDIRFHDGFQLDATDVQAWLATSRNGVRALARCGADRRLPLLAVGGSTAELARQAGFGDVRDADGDVDDLARLANATLDPADGALFHAAGSEVAGDLAGRLRASGYTVQRQVLYEAVMARQLRPSTLGALHAGAVDAALFYSPRSAAGFADLIAASGTLDECRAIAACCMSERAAAALKGVPFRLVLPAPRPKQSALLALLEQCVL